MNRIKKKFVKFNKYINEYLPNQNVLIKALILIDYSFALIIHGATIKDYFVYQFCKKSNRERKEFITEKRLSKIVKYFNKVNKVPFIRDKVEFNSHFSEYIHRDWLDPSNTSLKEFIEFIEKNKEIIVKPRYGHGGKGIRLLKSEEIGEKFEKALSQFSDEEVILEERLQQGGVIGNLNPSSVNTIRLVAVNTGGKIHFTSAVLRMGNGDTITDNVSNEATRGLAAQVDLNTGIVFLPARDIKGNSYIHHPVSRKQIVGMKIPEWERVLETVRLLADSIPNVRYTGWDIAVCEGGKIEIIEGNTYVGGYSQQVSDQIGKWNVYKNLMK